MLRSGTEHFEQHLGMPPGHSGTRMPNQVSTHGAKPTGPQSRSQETHHRHPASIHAMRIDSGRTHIRMSHLLHSDSNIRTFFQQMSCQRMPKGVAGNRFVYPGLAHRPANPFPEDRRRMSMVAAVNARTRIPADAGGWKPALPTILKRAIGVFAQQGMQQLRQTP